MKNIIKMINRNASEMSSSNIDIELIFANDFPEEVFNLCERTNISIKILNTTINTGIHATRVRGFFASKGDYILFLDQDDTISNNYISSQMKYMDDADAVLCNGTYRENRKIFSESNPIENAIDLNNIICMQNKIISPGQVLIKRSAVPTDWLENILKYNGLDDSFLWILMIKDNMRFALNEEMLYCHNENDGNGSFNWKQMKASKIEMLENVKRLGVLSAKEQSVYDKYMEFSLQKSDSYIWLDNLWEQMTAKNLAISKYLKDKGFNRIAIYAMGVYGMRLNEYLKNTEIEVCYGIDKNADAINGKLKMVGTDDQFPTVDIIINSATFSNRDIKKFVKRKSSIPVLGLDELLENVINEEN